MRGAALLFVLAACGGMTTGDKQQSGAGSCTSTTTMSSFTFRMCADYAGLTNDQVDAIQKACTVRDAGGVGLSATWSKSGCDRTGALGGCKIASGSFSYTIWFWTISGPGTDITLYKDLCTAQSGMWMNP